MERRPQSLVALLGLGPAPAAAGMRDREELYVMWSAARAEANLAYAEWQESPGSETYWSYRAAEERADAAEDALARACASAAPGQDGFRAAA